MLSAVINRPNETVEQISTWPINHVLFQVGNEATGSTIIIPLPNFTEFEIRRVRLRINYFDLQIPENTHSLYLYPLFEQFAAMFLIDFLLTDAAGNIKKTLILDMEAVVTDGITSDIIFREPFRFNTQQNDNLCLAIDVSNSIFDNLTGQPIGPGDVYNAHGNITLEGVSYPMLKVEEFRTVNTETEIAADIAIINLIEIDDL